MTAPGVWTIEEPGPARIHSKAFSVQAENVGHMRPILRHGPVFHEAHTLSEGWRKDSRRKP